MIRRLARIGLATLVFASAALLPQIGRAQETPTTGVSIIEPEAGTPMDWAYAPNELERVMNFWHLAHLESRPQRGLGGPIWGRFRAGVHGF